MSRSRSAYESALTGEEGERLRAARELRIEPRPELLKFLQKARARERVRWIRIALDEAITACEGIEISSSVVESVATEDSVDAEQAYADGQRDGLRQALHELAPIVGLARAAAEEGNETEIHRHLERLRAACSALRGFVTASAAREFREFDLSLIPLSMATAPPLECPNGLITARGVTPLLVRGDRDLFELALRPVVINAIEAVCDLDDDPPPNGVRISWGLEGDLCWVVVIDQGPGIEPLGDLFSSGVSGKPGHPGLGLATARTAMNSLGGRLKIGGSKHGGTTVLLEWQGAL